MWLPASYSVTSGASRRLRADRSKSATGSRSPSTQDGSGGKPIVKKSYAVGLEKSCPGGVCYWAPEIPSAVRFSRPSAEQM
jgi:hypothetical protein